MFVLHISPPSTDRLVLLPAKVQQPADFNERKGEEKKCGSLPFISVSLVTSCRELGSAELLQASAKRILFSAASCSSLARRHSNRVSSRRFASLAVFSLAQFLPCLHFSWLPLSVYYIRSDTADLFSVAIETQYKQLIRAMLILLIADLRTMALVKK